MIEFDRHLSSEESDFVAAVDLGSNSFHLVIGKLDEGRFLVVDELREMVRLSGGLDEQLNLTAEAQLRAVDCLKVFEQMVRDIPSSNIRAVGTNTFRKARNIKQFLPIAERALGHSIEVITGHEEARLIYTAVTYTLPRRKSKRYMVVDIGGGSTEVVCGTGRSHEFVESLYIGCVAYTRKHFPDGLISRERMNQAVVDALLEVRTCHPALRNFGWDVAIGCSGTIKSIATSLMLMGWGNGKITRSNLQKLCDKVVEKKHVSELTKLGFEPQRCEVLPGGLAILVALFTRLKIQEIEISEQALREGVIYDLIERLHDEDARSKTVRTLMNKWSVDRSHARRVTKTALNIYNLVAESWKIDIPNAANMLTWAAQLHEIGLTISHAGYHKHGAYVLQHSDLEGFSRPEQQTLGLMVRLHRRKFRTKVLNSVALMPRDVVLKLCIVLRLAVLLHRSRSSRLLPKITCSVSDRGFCLNFPDGWLDDHPLTFKDLIREKTYLQNAGYNLIVSSSNV